LQGESKKKTLGLPHSVAKYYLEDITSLAQESEKMIKRYVNPMLLYVCIIINIITYQNGRGSSQSLHLRTFAVTPKYQMVP